MSFTGRMLEGVVITRFFRQFPGGAICRLGWQWTAREVGGGQLMIPEPTKSFEQSLSDSVSFP